MTPTFPSEDILVADLFSESVTNNLPRNTYWCIVEDPGICVCDLSSRFPDSHPLLVASGLPTELWIEIVLDLDAQDVSALALVGSLSDAPATTKSLRPTVPSREWGLRRIDVSLTEEYLVPGGRYLVKLASEDRNQSASMKKALVRECQRGEPTVAVSYPFDVTTSPPEVWVTTDVSILDDATLRVAVAYTNGAIPGQTL
ncbi:hypothetical protein FA13DRAFT_1819227 [Coprinellus micaceus]|uniref:Uncharacterized protein n=1 Tax=Coprinellus micaceus TaxID=71717 RepID=A0A4Y7SJ32_COPMI|nr:hypothetical protein FA13DRAFT_1819227 [Coprinellus micaceus]